MSKIKNSNLKFGSVKKKIILFLATGVALGAAKTIRKQIKILEKSSKDWKEINRMSLKRSLNSLYNSKIVDLKPSGDNFKIVLSEKGKIFAKKFNLENLKIPKQENWDGKWRIVMFDVPERIKKVRDALRFHFKEIGLVEYQKSVFIYPYPCEREVKFIAEFYKAFPLIKVIIADVISDEKKFTREFDL